MAEVQGKNKNNKNNYKISSKFIFCRLERQNRADRAAEAAMVLNE